MHVAVVLLGLVLVSVAGLAILGMAQSNEGPVIDTWGNTLSVSSNASQNAMVANSGTVAMIGGNAGMIIALVFVAGLLVTTVYLIGRGNGRVQVSRR